MERDYLNLLTNSSELASLLTSGGDIADLLQRMVEMVARHLGADVCSIYLYDEPSGEIVLRATVGLRAEAVGTVRMKPGEGLVGAALADATPMLVHKASENPHFRHFPQAGEDAFESFLAVPMLRGEEKIGVLVTQRKQEHHFTPDDVTALRGLASQLAGSLESARLLLGVHAVPLNEEAPLSPDRMRVVHGTVASPGVVCAPAVVIAGESGGWLEAAIEKCPGGLCMEDFDRALDATIAHIEQMEQRLASRLPEVATMVFTAHLMMLKDDEFSGAMRAKILAGTRPCKAVSEVAMGFVAFFNQSTNVYMREKAADVLDVTRRLLTNLYRGEDTAVGVEGRIVVTHDLHPSDIVRMSSEAVAGFVLTGGGVTSHVSILARSLGIPTIIADDASPLEMASGALILLDGVTGNVYVRPSEEVQQTFARRESARQAARTEPESLHDRTFTMDGVRIEVQVNINLLSELPLALNLKAEGVGLYRSEFPFLIRSAFPSEDEQMRTYRRLVDEMRDREVTVRTLDIGGDKSLSYYDHGDEENPALGLRSIRLSLRHKDVFRQQIRAILQAGADRDGLRMMFPFISSPDEFMEARQLVDDCRDELERQGLPQARSLAVGMMIEIPSVAETIDTFVPMADFFSVGTNDFIQFMLAVDRSNEKIASYHCPHHPAVLRALARIARVASDGGKDLSVCGEMAHEPQYIPFLLGIGIRKLSVDPRMLPEVQRSIEGLTIPRAQQLAAAMLAETTVKGTASHLRGPGWGI